MITLHHLNSSRSRRILWLLEELEVEYEVIHYKRDPLTLLAPAALKEIHPLGKSPVITDGDITIAESAAIIEYLIRAYGAEKFPPPSTELERIQNSYWLHFAEGTLMPTLLLKLVFDKVQTSPMPFFVKPIARMICQKVLNQLVLPNVANNLALVESHLSTHQWFSGKGLGAADFQMSYPLEAAMSRVSQPESYPNIQAYLRRIHCRSAPDVSL